MKQILQVISDSNLGGAGRVLCNYFSAYDKSQFAMSVAVPQGSVLVPIFQDFGVKVYEIQGCADRSYAKEDVKVLRALLREIKPDLVHSHGAFSARVASKREHIPVVFSRHSVFPVSAKQRLLKPLLGAMHCHYADGIIAVSPSALDNLVQLGVPKSKITTIYNGVMALEKTSPSAQEALRESLGIQGRFTFGILARLEVYKGHETLLNACEILKERGQRFSLLIAGTGQEEDHIKSLIAQKNLGDVVQFLGFWKEVPSLLSVLDVQLNCSFGTEATSIALLEGMSLGLPSVVSDYGGNPYVISQGESGLVYPTGDALALADAMETMMGDQAFCLSCGKKGAERYGKKFTAQAFARETEKFYHQFC